VTNLILDQVRNKREEQDERWGQDNHLGETWMLILAKEVGELARALLEGHPGDPLYLRRIREEAVDVAAVAVAIAEQVQRQLSAGV